jgi:hypothetical protein
MTRPSVANLQALGDFANLINWDVTIFNAPSAVSPFLTADEINFRCDSTDVPTSKSQSATVMVRGFPVKQPGIWIPTQIITLMLYETIDNTVSSFIIAWRNACYDPITGAQLPKDQVTCDHIQLTRNDREGNPIWTYTLFNVFLEDYDPLGGQLQGQSADVVRPSITLSYDRFTDAVASSGGSASS